MNNEENIEELQRFQHRCDDLKKEFDGLTTELYDEITELSQSKAMLRQRINALNAELEQLLSFLDVMQSYMASINSLVAKPFDSLQQCQNALDGIAKVMKQELEQQGVIVSFIDSNTKLCPEDQRLPDVRINDPLKSGEVADCKKARIQFHGRIYGGEYTLYRYDPNAISLPHEQKSEVTHFGAEPIPHQSGISILVNGEKVYQSDVVPAALYAGNGKTFGKKELIYVNQNMDGDKK